MTGAGIGPDTVAVSAIASVLDGMFRAMNSYFTMTDPPLSISPGSAVSEVISSSCGAAAAGAAVCGCCGRVGCCALSPLAAHASRIVSANRRKTVELHFAASEFPSSTIAKEPVFMFGGPGDHIDRKGVVVGM